MDPSSPVAPQERSAVQSFDRAIAILNAFTPERPSLSVSQLARITGLSRSTTHRLLTSLQHHELVAQLGNRDYTLGPHILRLAQVARSRVNITAIARPIMEWLRDQSNETVGLHVPHGESARSVIDQAESRQPLRRTYTELGQPIPIHQGAPGKVLLAFRPTELQARILARQLEQATPHTITDAEELRAELRRVAEHGYAFSLEERVMGIATVAVPIYNHTGEVVGALSVTGPKTRLTEERLLNLVPLTRQAADRISSNLGYLTKS